MTDMYYIPYHDNHREWRWSFRSANHEIIYINCERHAMKQGAASARIYDETTKTWT